MSAELIKNETSIERAPAADTGDLLQVIARAAADPAVDVAKMEQLLHLQERVMAKRAEMEFNAAMSRLQPRLPRIVKKGRIEFTSQRTGQHQDTPYARYEDIDEAIRPLLFQEGFSLSFGTEALATGQGILVRGTLAHAMGHSRTESMPLPFDTSGSKNSIQAVGSAISYGKRYLVGALLNIVTVGEDDDATSLSVIDEHQVNTLLDMIQACDLDSKRESKFLEWMGVKAVTDIRRHNYEKGITMLRRELKKKKEAPA